MRLTKFFTAGAGIYDMPFLALRYFDYWPPDVARTDIGCRLKITAYEIV